MEPLIFAIEYCQFIDKINRSKRKLAAIDGIDTPTTKISKYDRSKYKYD